MCFLCNHEGCFLNILPWWPTRFLPVPGIVPSVMTLIIAGSFEYRSSTLMSKSEGKHIFGGRLGQAFRGRLKLILSRSIHSTGRVWHPLTSGNGLHLGSICLFELLTIHSVSIRVLLHSERRVFIKQDIEEPACIMDGGVLGNKVSDNLIKFLDHFGLDCTGFALSFRGPLISTVAETRLALLSEGQCILTHVSQIYIDTLEHY